MAQSGYTPILIYASGTTGNTPSAANMTSSASGAELALNYFDGKLFYKDASGNVQLLASKAGNINVSSLSFGTTGLTPSTATTGAITVGGTLVVGNGGTGLTTLAAGALTYGAGTSAHVPLAIGTAGQILTVNSGATAPQWTTLSGVAVTTFSAGTTGLTPSSATSGAITLAGTLNVANGGTGLTSLTAGYIPYGNGTSAFSSSSSLFFDGTNLGVGTSSPSANLDVQGNVNADVQFRSYNLNAGSSARASMLLGNNTNSASAGFFLNSSTNTAMGGANSLNLYLGISGAMTFITSGSERMRIDSSGNVGIGLSTMTAKFVVAGTTPNGSGAQATYPGTIQINESGSYTLQATGGLEFKASVFGSGYGAKIFGADNGSLLFGYRNNSASWTESMRIDSAGRLGVGTSSPATNGTATFSNNTSSIWTIVTSSPDYGIVSTLTNPAGGQLHYFVVNSTYVGAISSNGTITLYASASDYRLKENVNPITNALDLVSKLKPVTYTWKSNGSKGQGFIAHELQAVIPDAVIGEKDAIKIEPYEISPAIPAEVDKDGKVLKEAVDAVMGEKEIPDYQGVDTSFLIATLTAAIQELNTKVEAQAAIITALQIKVGA